MTIPRFGIFGRVVQMPGNDTPAGSLRRDVDQENWVRGDRPRPLIWKTVGAPLATMSTAFDALNAPICREPTPSACPIGWLLDVRRPQATTFRPGGR